MQKSLLHILPFETLIKSLKNQGFAIGVDSHLRIRALLEDWDSEIQSLDELKVQLGVILTRDEEEQAHFYRVFDSYVEKYSYDPTKRKKIVARSWREKYGLGMLFSLLALMLIALSLFGWWQNNNGPQARIAWAQQAGRQILWLEDVSTVHDFGGWIHDSIISRSWLVENASGTAIPLNNPNHKILNQRFEKAGNYHIMLAVESLYGKDTIRVPIHIVSAYRLSISSVKLPASQDNRSRLFRAQRFPFGGDSSQISSGIRQALQGTWTPLWKEQYSWTFEKADKITGSGDTVQVRFEEAGTWSVKLAYQIRGLEADSFLLTDTLTQAQTIEQQRGTVELEAVSFGFKQPDPENISDLLKDPKAPIWPWLVSLLLLGLYGLNELYLYLRRRPVLDSSKSRGPPMSQELVIDRPEWKLFDSEAYDTAMLKLRERKEGETEELDLPETLQATLDAGGLPAFVWKNREQAPQYLFLIEEKSHEDQLARYFEEWVSKLNDRDISAEYFFFDQDLYYVWKDRSRQDTEVELGRIAAEYSNYRLVILGSGEVLLNSQGPGLDPMADIFLSWKERALLSTRATEDWGWEESLIESRFPILPASEKGILALTDQWVEHSRPDYRKWIIEEREAAPPSELDDSIGTELKNYLGRHGYQWLCACAVYPELYWELSLRLGELVQEHFELAKEALPLERLIRLPWFRQGKLPRELRLLLNKDLDSELARKVRQALIHLLNQPQNQAPDDSYARQQQETTLAIYTYLNSNKDSQSLESLKQQLDKVSPHSIKDVVSVQSIADVTDNPLAIVLPRRFFRGGIKLYGTAWKLRLGALIGTLLLFWFGYAGLYEAPKPQRAVHPYPMSEYALTNPIDTGRYELYRAYHAFDSAQYTEAEAAFETAVNLLGTHPKATLATANLAKTRFRLAKSLYDQGQYARAAQAFTTCCIDTCKQAASYAAGLAYLNLSGEENTSLALNQLTLLDSVWYADTSNRESLYIQNPQAKGKLSKQLLDLRLNLLSSQTNNSPSIQQIDLLLSWMGEQMQNIDLLLQEADSLFNLRKFQEALDAYEKVLLIAPTHALALSGQQKCRDELAKINRQQALLSRADSLFNIKDCAQANSLYNQILNTSKDQTLRQQARDRIQECDSIVASERMDVLEEISGITDATSPTSRNVFVQVESSQKWPLKDELNLYVIFYRNIQPAIGDPLPFTFNRNGFLLPVRSEAIGVRFTFPEDSSAIQIAYGDQEYIPVGEEDTIRVRVSFPSTGQAVPYPPGFIPGIIDPDFKPTEMVQVLGGSFDMGDKEVDIYKSPVHEVNLSGFYMDKYEVTYEQYVAFLNEKGNPVRGRTNRLGLNSSTFFFDGKAFQVTQGFEKHPIFVSWFEAKAYADWLSAKTGLNYDLPTEAQWEYAARGGIKSHGYTYAGSDSLEEVGWYGSNSGRQTHPVGGKKPNELGLYDMSGNVWEWCQDWYGKYRRSIQNDPQGPESGYNRVIRGGSWDYSARYCRVSDRYVIYPYYRSFNIGFRLARSP